MKVTANLPFPATWSLTNGPRGLGQVTTIVSDPSDGNAVYAGTYHSGMQRSNDAGETWTSVLDKDGLVGTDTVTVTVSPVSAPISITPRTVKLRGKGDLTITARVRSSAGIDPRSLDPANVRLTSNPATSSGAPVAKKNNGSYKHVSNPSHAQFQFSLRELMFGESIPTGGSVRLYLIGTLPDGREFAGYDEVTVLPQ